MENGVAVNEQMVEKKVRLALAGTKDQGSLDDSMILRWPKCLHLAVTVALMCESYSGTCRFQSGGYVGSMWVFSCWI